MRQEVGEMMDREELMCRLELTYEPKGFDLKRSILRKLIEGKSSKRIRKELREEGYDVSDVQIYRIIGDIRIYFNLFREFGWIDEEKVFPQTVQAIS